VYPSSTASTLPMRFRLVFRAASIALFVAVLISPGAAFAVTQYGQQMLRNWAQADRCAAQATKQFPDYTADALAKRDQALQECLSNSVLPPRTPLEPQNPAHR